MPEHIDAVAPARSTPALRFSVMPLLATCPVEVAAYITGIGHVDVTAMSHNVSSTAISMASPLPRCSCPPRARRSRCTRGCSHPAMVVTSATSLTCARRTTSLCTWQGHEPQTVSYDVEAARAARDVQRLIADVSGTATMSPLALRKAAAAAT